MMSLNISPPLKVLRNRGRTPCLLQYANGSRNLGRFNDVTIKSGNLSIQANRIVLSCYCSYFDELFQSQTAETSGSNIDLHEVDGKSLELIIQYIYTGQICIDSENVLAILSVADKLEIDEMKQFCFEFLQDCITPENCIAILITAKKYKNLKLRDKVYEYISNNYQAMTHSPAFVTLEDNELFFIVYHLKTLYSINDEVLCQSLLSWTKYDEKKRTESLHRFITFVNVDHLSYDIVKDLLNESLFQAIPDFYDRLKENMEEFKRNEPKILSIGGRYKGTSVKVIYSFFDVTSKVYPDLPIPLYYHSSLVLNNFVYCVGGISMKLSNKVLKLNFNKTDLKWEEVASINTKRCDHGAAVFNDILVVCGGSDGRRQITSTEYYHLGQDVWKQTSSLNQARDGNQSVAVRGSLYTVGGFDGKSYLSTVERLNELDQPWVFVSSMQTPRSLFAAVGFDDVIYAVGGRSNQNKTLKSVEKYDCGVDKWLHVSEMNIERWQHSAHFMQGKIFVIGGVNAKGRPVKEIECYHPSTDRWEIVSRIDEELVNHSLVVL